MLQQVQCANQAIAPGGAVAGCSSVHWGVALGIIGRLDVLKPLVMSVRASSSLASNSALLAALGCTLQRLHTRCHHAPLTQQLNTSVTHRTLHIANMHRTLHLCPHASMHTRFTAHSLHHVATCKSGPPVPPVLLN